jgi:hypothetical protein
MGQLLASRGIRYVHVLQPNQYYSTRVFPDEERKIAFNDASPFKAGAERGYPQLERQLEPGALNAVHLFDRERAPMYVDDCCHYSVAANHLLADAIASSVLATRRTP